MQNAIRVQIFKSLQNLEEKLFDCILFLAFYHLLQCQTAPLHHNYGWILTRIDIQNLRNEFSSQSTQDVVLPDEACGQTDSAGPFESFDRRKFFALFIHSFVNLTVGSLCHFFEERILIDQSITFHHYLLSSNIIYSIYYHKTINSPIKQPSHFIEGQQEQKQAYIYRKFNEIL